SALPGSADARAFLSARPSRIPQADGGFARTGYRMAESEPALTVAICTRNRRELLLRALASLAAQQARAAWDVLVVENASDDDTRTAVAALAGDFPVPLAVASEPVRGLSHARNRALREARGRAVVFLDDDATCRAGWVAAH